MLSRSKFNHEPARLRSRQGGKTMWRKGLNKTERKHLAKDAGCRTKAAFIRTLAAHAAMRIERPEIEPCRECRDIARKLGLEVTP